jgi:2-polyprenyl-3-methyl-5-hydroxy-6-metoxy-1,4-benzoquinol methylase
MYIHEIDVHNTTAAERVVPKILKLFSPNSVLDVGCGIGTWLTVFKKHGVMKIKGIDGDYVNRNQLFLNIKKDEFIGYDLSTPFTLNEHYDLLICLEVAEHLPPNSAKGFIESLCHHSDVIIFGAAVPGQWGQNHLNEQWAEYWIGLFEEKGYIFTDAIRPQIWQDDYVEWWYKQNILIFTRNPISFDLNQKKYHSIIHPQHFKQKMEYIDHQNQMIGTFKTKIIKWEEGDMGIRKHWNTFLKAVKKKILHI